MTSENQTINSTSGVDESPVVEVHNCYALHEVEEVRTKEGAVILIFSRPQNWANPKAWQYYYCKIEVPINGTRYINHCHIWQKPGPHIIEACQTIASALFMIMQPGKKPELCANTHLAEEDFWCDEWGHRPPEFIDENDEYSDEDY
jgi:hypothetical protein